MKALLDYAGYLPAYRLGKRVVAAFDEDSTTMAVAAAAAMSGDERTALYFTTSTPAYADKNNASAVHAALGLPADVFAADVCGTGRSTFFAIRSAAAAGGLVVTADVRVGRAGSADEKLGGDGAAALRFGDGEAIAEPIGMASRTAEFLDRWRAPTRSYGQQWEERFGFERYAALIRETAAAALESAGLADVDHVALGCPNTAVVKRAATRSTPVSSPATRRPRTTRRSRRAKRRALGSVASARTARA